MNGAVVARVSNSMSNAHLAGSNRSGKTLLPGLFVLLPLLEDSLRDFNVLYPHVRTSVSRCQILISTDRDGRDAIENISSVSPSSTRKHNRDTHVVEGAIWNLEERRAWALGVAETRAGTSRVADSNYAVFSAIVPRPQSSALWY